MSEYRYYEFQAVDRPLTQKQMDELRCYSSRANITPSSFINEYNWGDLKGDPKEWMEIYFDAFLYLANWGTRWLMLRIPVKLLEPEITSLYCADENLACYIKGDHLILSFHSEDEDYEWVEVEGWLTSIIPLRADLVNGDYRCLYLGWLLGVQGREFDEETPEPPVPPGLGDLSEPLRTFADFLRIDYDLITVAAEQSDERMTIRPSRRDFEGWVANLPAKDKDDYLIRLLECDEPHIVAEFRQCALHEIRNAKGGGRNASSSDRRSIGELLARAEEITEERRKKESEQRAKEKVRREQERVERRKRHLESLIGKGDGLWAEVYQLIATRQPKRYDKAVSLLKDLRDLADMQGSQAEFSQRMETLYLQHKKKSTLVDRFRKAKLFG